MTWRFRKSKNIGPFRATFSKKGRKSLVGYKSGFGPKVRYHLIKC